MGSPVMSRASSLRARAKDARATARNTRDKGGAAGMFSTILISEAAFQRVVVSYLQPRSHGLS